MRSPVGDTLGAAKTTRIANCKTTRRRRPSSGGRRDVRVTRKANRPPRMRPIRAHRETFISGEEINGLAPARLRVDRQQFRTHLDQEIAQEPGLM
jgi:hypothetical protein